MNEFELFTTALELTDSATCEYFLDQECAGSPRLRARMEALLRNARQGGEHYLESPPFDLQVIQDEMVADKVGDWVGPYHLIEQIGEGGMGIVYLAEQLEPVKRQVAIKLIKPGMDSQQVVARFDVERQALAMMDHPNIARVLDAGQTETHRPYFVMELVRGIPITDYCECEQLNIRRRINLVIDVCRAVQHAHQKAIIHRDLKPSNVLVTLRDSELIVKVIDFGVAKALDQDRSERTLFTQFTQMVGTPLYMSPEQASLNPADVDTRSDIYSLGCLLYELLTGTTPFDRDRLRNADFDELRRIIREEEPVRPSARINDRQESGRGTISLSKDEASCILSQTMCGELDWIVMKALDKDRNRRYESANALATDLQRYLDDEPVLACPPSAAYRFRKYARRNWTTLTSVGFVVTALAIGTLVSVWQAIRATRAESIARNKQDRAVYEEQRAREQEVKALEAAESERIARQSEARQRARAEASEHVANERYMEAQRQHNLAMKRQATLRQYLYAADMKVVMESNRNGYLETSRAILDRHVPEAGERDLRGFAWYYLNHVCDLADKTRQDSLAFRGHTADVYFVAVSPNGKLVASASLDNTVRLWDADSGQCLRTLRGHRDEVNSVSFSPDGETVATGSDDRTVRIWNVATGDERRMLGEFSRDVLRVQFSPDGTQLAAAEVDLEASECCTTLWDLSTLTIKERFEDVFVLAFSPSGDTIAMSSKDLAIRLVDPLTGEVRHMMSGHNDQVASGVFTPDGDRLVTGSRNSILVVWDVATGREITRFDGGEFHGRTMAISPDGRFLAVGGNDGLVRIWHLASRRLERTINFSTTVWSLAYSPNGKELFVAGADGFIRRCNLTQTSSQRCLPEHSADLYQVVFSAAGNLLATVDRRTVVHFWNLPDATLVKDVQIELDQPDLEFLSICFLPDGRHLVLGDQHARLHFVDSTSGRTLERVRTLKSDSAHVAFSLDKNTVAAADVSALNVWRMSHRAPFQLELLYRREHAYGGEIRDFNLSASGGSLVVASSTNCVVNDIPDGGQTQLSRAIPSTVFACVFSPDGRWLATGNVDRSIKIWDAKSKSEHTTLLGHSRTVVALAFAPDGRTLASGSDNGEVKLWDLETGQELFDLPGHTGPLRHLAFSDDGQLMVTSGKSFDGQGEVWLWFAPRSAAEKTSATPVPIR